MILRLTLIITILLCSISIFSQNFTAKQDLNIRDGQGAEFKILGVVPKDSQVNILQISGNWGKLSFGDGYGYVSMKYLQVENSNVSAQSGSSHPNIVDIIGWTLVITFAVLSVIFKKHTTTTSRNSTNTRSTQKKRHAMTTRYSCQRCGEMQVVEFGKYPISRALCNDGKVHKWVQTF